MTRFPTAGHLVSWARYAPGVKEAAGKKKGKNATGHGNRYLARALGEAAVAGSGTDTFIGERYQRIARRRGKQKAIVAVGRSILVITWHLVCAAAAAHARESWLAASHCGPVGWPSPTPSGRQRFAAATEPRASSRTGASFTAPRSTVPT
jgi:hypothetical protein